MKNILRLIGVWIVIVICFLLLPLLIPLAFVCVGSGEPIKQPKETE